MKRNIFGQLWFGLYACGIVLIALVVGCESMGGFGSSDRDGDGVPNAQDAFPDDANESTDSDGDGVGDNADDFPSDASESVDTDGDGEGNASDTDDDGDGVVDDDDPEPLDAEVSSLDPPENPLAANAGDVQPNRSISENDAFETGRGVFERTYTTADGLGPIPVANGCATCHGTPVVGGSGTGTQARVVGSVTALLQRDTPALFGTGLFERVSDETILSLQDPLDEDEDGISGRPNIDVDLIGRFGLKAQAASLESITRGMLANQMGITSDPLTEAKFSVVLAQVQPPNNGGGGGGNDDFVVDPEISPADLADMIAFQELLAPPLRGPIDLAVDRGEALFASVGCADCHVPSLPLDTGELIYPYTDLLLHDMGAELSDALFQGAAMPSEFRTAPLWGLSESGPYLHDGRAETIVDAIDAHDGEATAAHDAFAALSDSERADLIRFLESL